MKKAKLAYLHSLLALLVCISMFIGSTFAWFTDSVASVNNIIKSGNLDIEMYWTDDLSTGVWYNVEDPAYNTIFSYDNWEPGYTDVKYIKLVNKGSLAFNYELTLTPSGSVGKLADVINVYYSTDGVALTQRSDLDRLNAIGLLSNVMNGGATAKGTLLAKSEESPLHDSSEAIITLALNMLTTAGNEYQNETIGDGFTITALASQCMYENDSFGNDYDKDASFPSILNPSKAEAELVDGKIPTGGLTIAGGGISATLPEDVKLEDGVQKLTVTVTPMEKTTSDITVVNQEILIPVDIHIDGVAEDNTAPIIIDLGAILPKYLNMGNYHLYHVEDGLNNEMTLVDDVADLTAHNQFTYDSDTGAVTVSMATFSEVALIADTENAWNGEEDTVFRGEGTADNPYIISSADELAGLSTLVSNQNATYGGAHYKLISDLDMNGAHARDTDDKQTIFYPIGYRVPGDGKNVAGEDWYKFSGSYFSGTFDGNGHTIGNIYQNTWLMDGDYDYGYWDDAMGIFGRVKGTVEKPAVIKNLRVDHFESDGEFAPTGCVATYADNAVFENIAVVNSNPRVYHHSNGGIVGCGGWFDRKNGGSLTFTNITVDNTNKMSALWGNWGTSCSGILGQWYGSSEGADYTVHFENCHTAAQIDANNDVCGNYQWYWYRYAGMVIGSIRSNVACDDGYIRPDMTGITASGCTVHFGDWNNYWYCELVANTIASYTHDHQFSRLTRVDAVDVENKTYTADGKTMAIPTSGRVNYVVVTKPYSTENATCYHFVDGNVWNHEDAGTEIVDANGDGTKEEVLKEDKQHYYLPFNQVFQGYGDGIMNIPLVSEDENLNTTYPDLDITILDNKQSAESEKKFAVNGTITTLSTEKTYNVGDLFIATGMGTIKSDKVQVTVSPADENSTVKGTFSADTSDWTKGTLTFSGTGAATITITDYYFCTPTTINVTITERQPVVKFVATTDHARYGVGTSVKVGDLFGLTDGVEVDSANVVVAVSTNDSNATVTEDKANWANGTIEFVAPGEFTVTITDNDFCIPTEIAVTIEKNNVTKFEYIAEDTNFVTGTTIKIGELFALADGIAEGDVDQANVKVTVDGVNSNYVENGNDWAQSELTFTSFGAATITITDNDHCIPTIVDISVSATKFKIAGNDTILTNGEPVELGYLFALADGIDEDDIDLENVTVTSKNVDCTYSKNDADWTKGTVTFSGCGKASVIITDNNYCVPTEIEIDVSMTKFEAIKNDVEFTSTETVTLGELFNLVDGVSVVSGKVRAFVTPVGDFSTADGTYLADDEDWTQSTLTFSNAGAATITITDYNYCLPTVINITVKVRQPEEKFETKFTGDFLYRVGNANAVALSSIFAAKDDVKINSSSVTVSIDKIIEGGNVGGTYTANASDWTKGTIQFNGTGVVKVTIQDDDAYCIPTVLHLEVVDAVNTTTAPKEISSNVVLLNDIGGGFTVSGNNTFYGNGFTLNYTGNGQYLNNGLKQGVVTVSENGTLDNLRIKATIYPNAYLYYGYTQKGAYVQDGPSTVEGDKTRYHYQLSAVAARGSATISNCYIYGGRTNVFVDTGNVTITDSVLECGTVANVQIQSTNEYTATFNNVTTIQHQVNATIDDTSKVMLGAGVIVGPDATSNPKIVLNGSFKQYNWVTAEDKNAVSDELVKEIIGGALNQTAFNHTVNGKTASNLGIIYMNDYATEFENNTGLPYVKADISMSGANGKVYSLQNASADKVYSDYETADRVTSQGDYMPTFNFDLGDQEISYDGSEDTRYLYGDVNGVTALYQDGEASLTLDLSKIAVIYKYTGLGYTYTVKCIDSSGNVLDETNGVVTLDAQGDYTLEFTVTDNIFYDKNGQVVDKSVTREFIVPLKLTVKAAQIKNAVVNITKTALDGVYNTVNLTDYELRIKFLDAISVTDYDNKGTGTTVNLSSNIASATLTPSGVNVFTTASTITITYTDGRVLTVNLSKISGSSPGTKTAKVNTSGSVYFTTEGALNNKPTETSSQNKCTITSVSYKGNSGSTVTNDTDVTVTWALGSSGGSSPCVTPDTLVTLADGSTKRIDEVSYTDKLLVWNFYEGKYDVAPIAIIFDHGADNNTVIKLNFSDGTTVNVVNMHQFFDATVNGFVTINSDTVEDYVGHKFAKHNGNSTEFVELESYSVSHEYVEAWGIMTAGHYNIITADMISADFDLKDVQLFNYFEVGEGMMFDQVKMQADIEKYGLYTYDDFSDYLTYEQFVAFNVQYFKIPVGKGLYTYEGILELIEQYLK